MQDYEMKQYVPEAKVVPRTLDVAQWDYVGVRPTDKPLLIHAPTEHGIKGSEHFEKCLEELRGEGLKFEYRSVSKMPNAQLKELLRSADIILDQLHIGWHGVLAMECMAMGKPVAVYIREDLEEQFGEKLPVVNCNLDNLKEKLRSAIKDYELRKELSEKSRDFVERHHAPKRVATDLLAIYKNILNNDKTRELDSPAITTVVSGKQRKNCAVDYGGFNWWKTELENLAQKNRDDTSIWRKRLQTQSEHWRKRLQTQNELWSKRIEKARGSASVWRERAEKMRSSASAWRERTGKARGSASAWRERADKARGYIYRPAKPRKFAHYFFAVARKVSARLSPDARQRLKKIIRWQRLRKLIAG